MMREEEHIPVMKEEVLSYLFQDPKGFYVDATIGAGGHARALLEMMDAKGHLLAMDQDEEALKLAQKRLNAFGSQVTFVHANFREIKDVLLRYSIPPPRGILLDLGLSSMQVDNPRRGFSYSQDGPLDMRMDQDQEIKAYDLINTYSLNDLTRVIEEYGEERWARRIAEFILKRREEGSITRTNDLTEIIKEAIPARFRRKGPHPARRTFMALRMAVNDELNALREVLRDAIPLLEIGGRLVVISFHSLEDRLVKKTFLELALECTCPRHFPVCSCDKRKEVEILTKRPLRPSEEEVIRNPRSRSGSLRVAEKV